MVSVTLCRMSDGRFASCEAKGHAGAGAAGEDIVCSAVTVLLRTAMQVLCNTPGVTLQTKAHKRGELWFKVLSANDADSQRLVCVADFIETGICALAAEYPHNVKMSYKGSKGERNG